MDINPRYAHLILADGTEVQVLNAQGNDWDERGTHNLARVIWDHRFEETQVVLPATETPVAVEAPVSEAPEVTETVPEPEVSAPEPEPTVEAEVEAPAPVAEEAPAE